MNGVIYDTEHVNCRPVCKAFAKGSLWPVVRMKLFDSEDRRPCFFYGIKRGGRSALHHSRGRRTFFFCDNGYLGKRWQEGGYYRITRDDWMMPSIAAPDYDRLAVHGIEVAPWQKGGRHILVCPPIPEYCKAWSFNGSEWQDKTINALKQATRRPIEISYKWSDPRGKPDDKPLAERLQDCWAVVTHDSNVAIDALIAGVPVFMTGKHPAVALGRRHMAQIEEPARPDNRLAFLAMLAANQWTLEEFAAGVPQKALGIV